MDYKNLLIERGQILDKLKTEKNATKIEQMNIRLVTITNKLAELDQEVPIAGKSVTGDYKTKASGNPDDKI